MREERNVENEMRGERETRGREGRKKAREVIERKGKHVKEKKKKRNVENKMRREGQTRGR